MAGLYPTLLRILRESDKPMTSAELFDHPDVKLFDVDAVRVSDYLGNLWRQGEVRRVSAAAAANAGARARYAYEIVRKDREIADVNSARPYVEVLFDQGGVLVESHGSFVVVKNASSKVEVHADKVLIR